MVVVGLFWKVVGRDGIFFRWWVYFEKWWVVIGLFWVVVGLFWVVLCSGRIILGDGGSW